MPKQLDPTIVSYDDVEFAIYPFKAMTAAGISGDLAQFAGPIISAILPLFSGSNGNVDDTGASAMENMMGMSYDELVPLIKNALSTLDSNNIQKILSELLLIYKNINCEYRDDTGRLVQQTLTRDLADELFIGSLDSMLNLAIDVVKVNYGDFFGRLLAQSGSLRGQLTNRSSKNTASSKEAISVL